MKRFIMQILVSTPVDGNTQARVSTFFNKNEQLERVKLSLKVPYYIYDLNVKLEREQLNDLLDKLKSTEVKIILEAEAAKFCKKKYDRSLDYILDHIIAVG